MIKKVDLHKRLNLVESNIKEYKKETEIILASKATKQRFHIKCRHGVEWKINCASRIDRTANEILFGGFMFGGASYPDRMVGPAVAIFQLDNKLYEAKYNIKKAEYILKTCPHTGK